MLNSVTNLMQEVSSQPLGLLLAFILGMVSTITSACCALPALGILIGYSGIQAESNRKSAVKKAMFFILGVVVSLMIIGGVAVFVGHAVQIHLSKYWKIFAGILMIFFGLAALKLLPFNLSIGKFDGIKKQLSMSGAILAGFALGGAVAASSLCCNPAIFIVIGVAVIQKSVLWSMLLICMFAVGFSLPLGAILLGVSLSKARFLSKGAELIVRWIAGVILVVAGFYSLITL